VLPAYKLMNIKDVEITKDVGEGGFATIQMGKLKNTAISRRYDCERVAVKIIKSNILDSYIVLYLSIVALDVF
jgi:hypothetical protein